MMQDFSFRKEWADKKIVEISDLLISKFSASGWADTVFTCKLSTVGKYSCRKAINESGQSAEDYIIRGVRSIVEEKNFLITSYTSPKFGWISTTSFAVGKKHRGY